MDDSFETDINTKRQTHFEFAAFFLKALPWQSAIRKVKLSDDRPRLIRDSQAPQRWAKRGCTEPASFCSIAQPALGGYNTPSPFVQKNMCDLF